MAAEHVKVIDRPFIIHNSMDAVEIYGSILSNNTGEETLWPALLGESFYYVSGDLDIRSGLKIEPGSGFKFAEGKMIKVTGNGYLKAQGTEQQNISFSGLENARGFWNGILFQTNSNNNFLKHTQILHAGKSQMPGIFEITSVGVDGDFYASLILANSKVAHGNGYGIVVETGRATINADVETVNTFNDLTLGNIKW